MDVVVNHSVPACSVFNPVQLHLFFPNDFLHAVTSSNDFRFTTDLPFVHELHIASSQSLLINALSHSSGIDSYP